MLIKPNLISASEQRFKQANFSPLKLDKKLGDGPLEMTVAQKKRRYRQILEQTDDPKIAQLGLERIINGNDLDSINYLLKGTLASHSVCRIQLKDAGSNLIGYASGFLIGPGVLMTNHHVFGSPADATNSIADFDYELDIAGTERNPVRFGFLPSKLFYTNDLLDYSIVAVSPVAVAGGRNLSEWGWLPLDGEPGKGDPGEYLTIIQHPGGQTKQVCVRENKLLKYVGNFVWYMTDTTAGSSGSPVFNRFWKVVSLHHSGVPKKDPQGRTLTKDGKVWDDSMDESLIDWIANEGVRVSAIVADLKVAIGSHPLVKPLLEAQAPPPIVPEKAVTPGSSDGCQTGVWIEQSGESTSLVVPIRVPIAVIRKGIQRASAPLVKTTSEDYTSTAVAGVGTQTGLPMESVNIDQSTLGTRPGYLANFLGSGKLAVPLPKISASLKGKIATLKAAPAQSELKYFNY